MNVIAAFSHLDTAKMSPFFNSLMRQPEEARPILAWQIDATTGKPVGRWLTLPKRQDRF
jgi:hypothetical protein